MRALIRIVWAAAILTIGPVQGEEPVHFSDQKLQACVERALGIIDPTQTDMLELTELTCTHTVNDGIKSLTGIQHATNLKRLRLSYNQINSISALSGLANLTSLTINDNQIGSLSPLSNLKELTHIDAHRNQIQGVSGLSGLKNLQELILRDNQISSISGLSGLLSLRKLHLQDNQLSQISSLSSLSGLTELELDDNRISSISALSGLENLARLDLSGNDIGSIGPLTSLTGLRSVNLKGNFNLNDAAYSRDLQALLDKNPGVSLQYDPRPRPSVQVSASKGIYSDRIRVAWERVDNGPQYTSYYRVYRALASSHTKMAISEWQRSNVFVDESVTADVVYDYWVGVAVSEIGANEKSDNRSDTGWARQPILTLTSTAGGNIHSNVELSGVRVGDSVEIVATPIDPNLFVFEVWTGSAVEKGKLADPTDSAIQLNLDEAYNLRAHFVTTLSTLHVAPAAVDTTDLDLSPELGTSRHPLRHIQDAIDVAREGVTIMVQGGRYAENLRLRGHSIVLAGIHFPVLHAGEVAPLVSFVSGEDANCILNGFLLTQGRDDLASAIYCDNSHPTIANCLIVGNQATDPASNGSVVYATGSRMSLVNCTIADNLAANVGAGVTLVDSDATIVNSILWNNGDRDIRLIGSSHPSVHYNDISVDPLLLAPYEAGLGNLSVDPRFVRSGFWTKFPGDAAVWTVGDYHLRSQSGRWDSNEETWVLDHETSPCIDGGEPGWPVAAEPMPNGDRMNMGAYGGTEEASKSTSAILTDLEDFSLKDNAILDDRAYSLNVQPILNTNLGAPLLYNRRPSPSARLQRDQFRSDRCRVDDTRYSVCKSIANY